MSDKFIVQYLDLLEKPFKLNGRGPDEYDCWGLCMEMGRRVGITLLDDFTPTEGELQNKVIMKHANKDFLKLAKPEPYCIVTFSIEPPFVDHCGFVLEDCRHFIHIMRENNVVVNRLDNRRLCKRIEGFYQWQK